MATAAPVRQQFPRNKAANYGVQVEPIPGINLTALLMNVSLDCDRRYHELDFQCVAVNFTGGAGKAVTKITSTSGAGATGTLTLSAFNVPTAFTVVAGGTGWVVGDTFTIADATGAGFVGTVATVSSGAMVTATVTQAGTATAIDPRLIISNIQVIVGTTAVIESTAAFEIFRADINETMSTKRSPGQFTIYFTEPWRRTTDGRLTSWDMAGQNVFSLKFTMVPGWSQVAVTGEMVFDYIRNTTAGEIDQVTYQGYVAAGGNYPAPQLRIIARKILTPQLNGGDTLIQPALIPTGWPILRLHFFPGTLNTITKMLMKADTQIVAQGQIGVTGNGSVLDQLNEFNLQWGFNNGLSSSAPNVKPDYSYIADYDQRVANALKVASLQLTVTSTIAEPLTILQEYLETSYS